MNKNANADFPIPNKNAKKYHNLYKPTSSIDNTLSKEELVKLHEFTRENRLPPMKQTDPKEYFEFSSEDDPKYNFSNPKYYLNSKLMLKAILWSTAIGTCFFIHRYYRRQNLSNAIRWGVVTWGLSFWYVWGTKEAQPYVNSIYHAQMIQTLTKKEHLKTRSLVELQSDINAFLGEDVENFSWTWNFLKGHLLTENEVLRSLGYEEMKLNKISIVGDKRNGVDIDGLIEEDFGNKDIYNNDENGDSDKDKQYDYSVFHIPKKNNIDEKCFVDMDKYINYEMEKFGKISPIKKYIIKQDLLSKPIFKEDKSNSSSRQILGDILTDTDIYLNGKYNMKTDPMNHSILYLIKNKNIY
jgi:hypothetical protein